MKVIIIFRCVPCYGYNIMKLMFNFNPQNKDLELYIPTIPTFILYIMFIYTPVGLGNLQLARCFTEGDFMGGQPIATQGTCLL